MTTTHHPDPRPSSPWAGSQHETRHRWQLDGAVDLVVAARVVETLAAELTAAHHAGWWLVEPMRAGHLTAARASRRRRGSAPLTGGTPRPVVPWRLRVVDEPPTPGLPVLDSAAAELTPIVAWTGSGLEQVSGPALPAGVLTDAAAQVASTGLPHRLWGVAPARFGTNVDLVADGGALRGHAVEAGVLVRTHEALAFQHAADGAATLLEAAAAYELLATTAVAMADAGGRIVSADDGIVQVSYASAVG